MLIGNATVVEIEFGLRPQVQKYKTESLRDEVLDFCAAASSSLEDEVRTRAFRPSMTTASRQWSKLFHHLLRRFWNHLNGGPEGPDQ
jgi:hypothetical protein